MRGLRRNSAFNARANGRKEAVLKSLSDELNALNEAIPD
jgi:hypothetical protein